MVKAYLYIYIYIYIKETDYFRKKRQISSGDCIHIFWVGRGFPHQNRKGPKSGLCLIKEIIPRYGIPISIG
jgi:hypothetical protein